MVMGELTLDTQLLVIGAGPGGYAAAFRAADLGLEVTMVDISDRPGGECRLHAIGGTGDLDASGRELARDRKTFAPRDLDRACVRI